MQSLWLLQTYVILNFQKVCRNSYALLMSLKCSWDSVFVVGFVLLLYSPGRYIRASCLNLYPPSFPTPPRQPPPTPRQSNRNEWNYNPDGVGRNIIDSFVILQLNYTATKREIKIQYRRLARIYHHDKYDGSTNLTTKMESQEHFKLINNTYEFLRTFQKFRITYVCRSHRLYIMSHRDYYYYYYKAGSKSLKDQCSTSMR